MVGLVLVCILSLMLVYFCRLVSYSVYRTFERFKQKIFWNVILRCYLQVYLTIGISCMNKILNREGSEIAIIMLVTLLLTEALIIVILTKYRD